MLSKTFFKKQLIKKGYRTCKSKYFRHSYRDIDHIKLQLQIILSYRIKSNVIEYNQIIFEKLLAQRKNKKKTLQR